MIIAYNIGCNGSPLNMSPIIWELESFKEIKESFRSKDNIETLFEWASDKHVPPSKITINMSIREDAGEDNWWEWEFIVRMINVREYRKHWEEIYQTKWEEPSEGL